MYNCNFNHPKFFTWEVVRIVFSLFVLITEVKVDTVKVEDRKDVTSEVLVEVIIERVFLVDSSEEYIDEV